MIIFVFIKAINSAVGTESEIESCIAVGSASVVARKPYNPKIQENLL